MRFLFCALASHGYVYPAISIAQELQQRGHEVAFVTGKAFAQVLAETGIRRIRFGPTDGDSFTKKFFGLVPEIVRQVKHIQYAYNSFPPDVLVATPLTIGPLIASRQLNIPAAVIGLAAYLWPTWNQAQTAPQTDQEAFRKHIHDGLIDYYLQACQIFGIAPPLEAITNYQNTPLLGDIYLLRSVPSLQGDTDLLPERVHLVGACHWEPQATLDSELLQWMQRPGTTGLPLIFVQHGTHLRPGVPDFLPNLFQAVTHLPVRIVTAVSHGHFDANTLPENVYIQEHISHNAILPYADAVIALGSTNPVLGTLVHGLPMLLIPNAGEELFVAELCQHAGVAISRPIHNSYRNEGTPENVTPEKLRQAVQEVLANVSLRDNARRLQAAFQQVQHNHTASTLLEMLAVEQGPLFRSQTGAMGDLSPLALAHL
ncbi:MAG: glycosyltransferase [Anaerolineae bacterium]|nr:glycosyltransferase [Anaerolineae bacterium]